MTSRAIADQPKMLQLISPTQSTQLKIGQKANEYMAKGVGGMSKMGTIPILTGPT